MSFPKEKIPYCSILINEGAWDDLYCILMEPSTASFDRLDVARLHKEYTTLKQKSEYNWHLNFTISKSKAFNTIDADGELL